MEDALSKIFNPEITVPACSRTAARVHAKKYVCSFEGETTIPTSKIATVVNTYLPGDIRAYNCIEEKADFNARFDTKKKAYEYTILNREVSDPLLRNYAWHYPIKLDVEKMQKAARIIQGKRDFACFCAAGSSAKTTVRNLMHLDVKKEGDLITIRAEADGFLYNMVRIIVGTLVYIGNGKLKTEDLKEIIENKDRRLMGITAPPEGLMLVEVCYE